ncbi:MAG: ATP-dependent Clp protease adaptor ClpS [Phycisphaera sp.]|nr:MAG: ATP-dependent Clp protease adaptor ClpS [Phycisphaera sp.]
MTTQDTIPVPTTTDPAVDQLPPFRVLLHNDDEHDMLYVVESLVDVTPIAYKPAARIMLEAHMRGAAHVMTTHKERAEFYRDRLRSKGLVSTIEPVDNPSE